MTERRCVDALSTLQVDLWMETDEFLRFWSTYSFGTRRTAFLLLLRITYERYFYHF